MKNTVSIERESDLSVLDHPNLLDDQSIKIIEFSPGKITNPFSNYRIMRLRNIIEEFNSNDTKVIILYGGKGNSFCVGGDFNETSEFTGGEDVKDWLDNVVKTYKAILNSNAIIIAAIDGYAIGFGFQMALLCDYRIGSITSELQMPELKKGISCNFGALLLEKYTNRSVMNKMVYGSKFMKSDEAEKLGIYGDICTSEELLMTAINKAKEIALYPSISAIKGTKNSANRDLIQGLDDLQSSATIAHQKAFSEKIPQKNMKDILNKSKKKKDNETFLEKLDLEYNSNKENIVYADIISNNTIHKTLNSDVNKQYETHVNQVTQFQGQSSPPFSSSPRNSL